MAGDSRLAFDILAKVRGEHDVKKLGEEIEHLGKSTDTTSTKFKDGAKDSGKFSAEIERTRARVKELGQEFDRTGDKDVLRSLRKERGALGSLEKLHAEVKKLGVDGELAGGLLSTAVKGMGDEAAAVGSGFSSLFSNPIVLGVGIAAAAVAGLAVGIFLLAAAGGAVLAGLGVGFIALGALAVAGSERVDGALTSLGDTAMSVLHDAASNMEGPIVDALNTMKRTVEAVGPSLGRMFTAVGPMVDKLADGLSGLVENAMPGLESAMDSLGPVFDALKDTLPIVGTAIGDFFSKIGEEGPAMAHALGDAIRVLAGIINRLGDVLHDAGEAYDWLDKKRPKWLKDAAESFWGINDAQTKTSGSAKDLGTAESDLGADIAEVVTWTKSLIEAMGLLNGAHISVAEAEIGARDAVDSLSQSLKASHGSFTRNTEAGRKSETAMIAGLHAASKLGDAVFDASLDGDKATAAFNQQVAALRAHAIAAGASKAKVDALIAGFVAAQGPARTSADSIKGINIQLGLLKDKQVTARARADDAEVIRLQHEIDALHGKELLLTVKRQYAPLLNGTQDYFGNSVKKKPGALAGGGLARLAGGGISGLVRGPGSTTSDSVPALLSRDEFVTKASSVAKIGLPAMDFMNRTGTIPGGRGGVTLTVVVNAPNAHPAEVGKATVDAIQAYERRNGAGWRSA